MHNKGESAASPLRGCGLTAYSGGIHSIWSPKHAQNSGHMTAHFTEGNTWAYQKEEWHAPLTRAGRAKPEQVYGHYWDTHCRTEGEKGRGGDAGRLYTFPACFPDGSATSTQATVATSIFWSLATSGTGTSGAPSSRRCRLCGACGTASGTKRAASQC